MGQLGKLRPIGNRQIDPHHEKSGGKPTAAQDAILPQTRTEQIFVTQ